MASTLFSSYRLRDLDLRNRIVVSPMGQYSAREGNATDWHLVHLGNLSLSGAGLLILEASAVDRNGLLSPNDLGIFSDENAAALAPSIAFCRKYGGAKLGMQLHHSGRKGSVSVAWEGQKKLGRDTGGWTTYAASAIPYPNRQTPEPLDAAGIQHVVRQFAAAARRADGLGIDLLELHCAHGYLIHNFLSPLSNTRTDAYGGSLENRMRFALEVFSAVRAAWPERKPLGVRVSATDWVEGGWDLDQSVVFATALRKAGCDYICASSGGCVPEQSLKVYPGYQVPFAERIRREASIPTMAVGLITEGQQAEDILRAGQADLVALGRGMLFNPRWPWKAAVDFGEEFFYPMQYERAHPSMLGGDFLKPARKM